MTTTHDDMPLPEAVYVLGREGDGYSENRLLNEPGYTADQLRARDAQWQARLEAAERDAARYREKRDIDLRKFLVAEGWESPELRELMTIGFIESYNATIDAAIRARG